MADLPVRPYWAAEPDIKKLAPRCLERFAWWMSMLKRSGRWDKMRSSLAAYYGLGMDGTRDTGRLKEAGEQGEVIDLHVNQVRPIVTNMMSLIAGVDPVVKPRATSQDAQSLASTRLAQTLMETYGRRLASNERELDTVRGGLIASAWTLGQSWMPTDGKEWATGPDGQPLYEGDVSLFVLPPWRVVADFAAQSEDARKWVLFRRPLSRFDVAAQFEEKDPALAKRLRQTVESSESIWQGLKLGASIAELDALLGEQLPQEDVVWVWELRHLKTPALPMGRLVRFVEPDLVLWDSLALNVEYPYKQLHCFEYAPERVVVGAAGHTATFDLGALQEFVDIATTSMATTTNINGQMHFWSQDEGVQARALSLGNTVITSKTEPKPLMFPALNPGIIEAAQWAIEQARQSAALNNVVMGQPDKGMPASAQALQRAQAQQYHAVAQGERVRLRQRNVNGQLELLQRFARAPRIEALVGKAKSYEIREWSAKDIENVQPFDVEPVDPYSASFEGRQALLEMLMQTSPAMFAGRPDALLTYVQTGSLATVTEMQTAQRELVEANVALLRKGIGPPMVDIEASLEAGSPQFIEPPEGQEALRLFKSDPHHLAVPAYLGVLASPSSRSDAKLMQAATEAVQLSLEMWAALTPDEAMAFGIPPLPSQMMAGMMPGAPASDEPQPDAAVGEQPTQGEGPRLPKPPENPLTGAQEDSGATGLVQ